MCCSVFPKPMFIVEILVGWDNRPNFSNLFHQEVIVLWNILGIADLGITSCLLSCVTCFVFSSWTL